MLRKIAIGLVALVLLAGCGERYSKYVGGGGFNAMLAMQDRDPNAQVFSYSHVLALLMAHDAVKPRFEIARDACLKDAALNCKLIASSISDGTSNVHDYGPAASLIVALPHDKVALFEALLQKPLTEDGSQKPTVTTRTTSAEAVGNAASSIEQKVAQLTAYRDSLAALAKRSDISVADMMKVAAELSKVQGELDAALAEQREIGERIARERLTVSLYEAQPWSSPLAAVWKNAGGTLTESTASALDFLIRIVPWLPIIGVSLVFVAWVWRLARRKKAQA